MPPSVLHVAESTDGGVGAVLADLAGAQAAAGWQVSVAAPPDPRVVRAVTSSGGTAVAWRPGARPGPSTPAVLLALARAVRDVDPDLVHLHSSMAGLCGRLVVRRRRPTLFQPHAWSFYALEGRVRRAAQAWERAGGRWADAVLCVSEDERRAAEALGVHGRFVVIPNGVDLTRFRPFGEPERTAARARLGLGTEPLAVCVGRLHRQKGQHRLLDAWPAVRARVPGARLALVGDGPDRTALAERAGAGVQLVGASPVVHDWLAAASVVAQPSTWEGMSLSLLEARACARSVVVTDVSGMREVVTPGTGAVVGLDDAAALAGALADRLLDPDLADDEGRRARELVEAQHDLERRRGEVLALAGQLAAGGRP